MINKPTVVELLSKAENRYSLVIATAKRARQISQGSKPLTTDQDTSPITLAADEIDEGKLKIYNEQQWKEIDKEKNESTNTVLINELDKSNEQSSDK